MSRPTISWDEPGRQLAADPGATLALDRSAWESLGARFLAVDDGQGETPGLATASVSTPDGKMAIGILDYGERTTYLLVPGTREDRNATATEALECLAASGAITFDDVIDVIASSSALPAPEPTAGAPTLGEHLPESTPADELTPRQSLVLLLLLDGLSLREIAEKLDTSVATVRTHHSQARQTLERSIGRARSAALQMPKAS